MKEKFNNLKNNPEFQAKLEEMRPKKTIWGFILILLLFFLPELINVLWSQEITSWFLDRIKDMPSSQLKELQMWIIPKIFDGEVSWVNLLIGIGFLVWMFRNGRSDV